MLGDVAAPGTVARLRSIVALRSPLGEGLDLGEDSFMWPHPVCSDEALIVVDDAAKRATGEVASRGREGVEAILAKMCDAIVVVARLGVEARHQMVGEVAVPA